MKKITALTFLLILAVTLLAACGSNLSKPNNGTYKSEGILSQSWTFSDSNNITMSTVGGLISSSGTYTINGTNMTITSTMFGTETTTGYTITEITSKSFFINGEKFIKQ